MKLRRYSLAVGTALALVSAGGAIAGCGASSNSAGSSSSGSSGGHSAAANNVTIRVTGDYDTLDPYKTVSSAAPEIAAGAYETLVIPDDKGNILPYLATSWTASPTEVTLKIRPDVTCADGTHLTSADVARSLRRFVAPATGAPGLTAAFGKGPFTVSATSQTVTLRSKVAFGELLVGLTAVPIICPAGLDNPAALANKIYGSGPYVLTSSHRGSSYTFTRRTGWTWGPKFADLPAGESPKTITFKIVANESTAANLLTTNGLTIGQVTGPEVKRLSGNASLALHPVRDFGLTFIQYNEAPGHVTDDEAVRRAVSQAVDRNAFNVAMSGGHDIPTPSIFPTNLQCYDPTTAQLDPAFDPSAAKATLQADGWTFSGGTWSKNGQPLAIKIIAWEGDQLGPDYALGALEKIGVKASLAKTSIATWSESAQKGDFDIIIVPNQTTAPSIFPNLSFITGPGGKVGVNWGLTKNPVAEHWTAVAGANVGTKACAAWSKVQKAYAERSDIKPLVSETYDWFTPKGMSIEAVGATLYPFSIRGN